VIGQSTSVQRHKYVGYLAQMNQKSSVMVVFLPDWLNSPIGHFENTCQFTLRSEEFNSIKSFDLHQLFGACWRASYCASTGIPIVPYHRLVLLDTSSRGLLRCDCLWSGHTQHVVVVVSTVMRPRSRRGSSIETKIVTS
jgi:hypothetical protein